MARPARRNVNKELEEKLTLLRGHLSRNLKFLCKEYLGTKDWSGIHDELQRFLITAGNRIHIELPRGHLKSWIVTQGWTIQQMLANPDIRILIVNAVEGNANKMLRYIRTQLTRGSMLSRYYGGFETEVWNQEELIVRQRKTPSVAPTFMAAGLQKTLTSQHFDVIVVDDLVEPDNVRTKEQRDKVYEFYLSLFDLLEPNGKMVVIGTRYHQDDLYSKILEDHKLNGGWSNFIKNCWKPGKEWQEPIFPEKHSVESLRAIYNKPGGKYHFAAQYMNNPIDPESADFRADWVKYYEPTIMVDGKSQPNKHPSSLYMTVDPAISLSRDADYTAMLVGGQFQNRTIRIVDYVHKRMLPNELVDEVFRMVEKWNLHRIGLETFAFQKTLKYDIQNEQRRRNKYFSIDELGKRSGVSENVLSKEARIRRLQPLFEQGLFEIRKDMNDFVDELLAFPRGKHDDLIDCAAWMLDYLVPSQNRLEQPSTKHGSMAWWVERMKEPKMSEYQKFMADLK